MTGTQPLHVIALNNDQAMGLIDAARSGDERAIKQLYDACKVVHSHILKHYRDPVFASEIWHDTVIEIWKGATQYRGHARFTTWAVGIARNLAATAWRKRARPANGPLTIEPFDEAEEVGIGDPPVFGHADPYLAISAQQRRDSVLACIRKLSPKLQDALCLVYYAEMPQEKIASLLAINLNTLKTRVRDAHLKVKACLGPDAGAPND
ncbi:MAG: RNA polymerase sigma factor [Burkholderiales bacterium]|nr:RNA polymerase sigma factor [Burkholderiales bacterium]